jgi:hypothetical protein
MGIAASEEYLINLRAGQTYDDSKIALTDDGGWILSWIDSSKNLVSQRYDNSGVEVGGLVVVGKGVNPQRSTVYDVMATDAGGWLQSYETSKNVNGETISYFHAIGYDETGNETFNFELSHGLGKYVRLVELDNGKSLVILSEPTNDYDDHLTATVLDSEGKSIAEIDLGVTYNGAHSEYSEVTTFQNGAWSIRFSDEHGNQVYRFFNASDELSNTVSIKSGSTAEFRSNGDYVVTRSEDDAGTKQHTIIYDHFDSAGTLLSTETLPAFTYQSSFSRIQTEELSDGRQLMLWAEPGFGDPLKLRVLDAENNIVSDVTLATGVGIYFLSTDILELSDGGWVVFWNGVQQVFNPDGTRNGDAVRIFAGNPDQKLNVVATDDGGWKVTYTQSDPDEGGWGTFYRVFHPNQSNNAPEAISRFGWLNEDSRYRFFPDAQMGYDWDGDAISQVVIDRLPAVGELKFDGSAVAVGDIIDVVDLAHLIWKPPADLYGDNAADMLFKVVDEHGVTSENSARYRFDIWAVNDAPWGADNAITLLEDQTVRIRAKDIPFFDSDGNSLKGAYFKWLDEHGTIRIGNVRLSGKDYADLKPGIADTITFTPDKNSFGDNYSRVSVQVSDDGDTSSRSSVSVEQGTHTLRFNVLSVNDAPVSKNASIWVGEEKNIRLIDQYFSIKDVENDDIKSIIIDDLPDVGTLRLGNKAVRSGDEIKIADILDINLDLGKGESITGSTRFTFFARDDGGTKNGGLDVDVHANNFVFKSSDKLDVQRGTAKADTLHGTAAKDIIDGGAGKDVLSGGFSDDTLYGGSGADIFVLSFRSGTDRIQDFDLNVDRIDLRGTTIRNFHDVKDAQYQYSSSVLEIGYVGKYNGQNTWDSVYLMNVDFDDLSAKNFIF